MIEKDDLAKMLKGMGAQRAKAEINPDRSLIPYE